MFAIEDIKLNNSRDLDSIQRVQLIARRFHSLEGLPFIDNWDPIALDEWASTVASSGERHAARFILHVWNSRAPWKSGRFDFFDAFNTWDQDNRDAFLAWVMNPTRL